MTTVIGAATAAPLPPLDTPEARWAYVLTLWHSRSLPAPDRINVGNDIHIKLPDNARRAVDQWCAALGCGTPELYDSGGNYQAGAFRGDIYIRAFCPVDPEVFVPITPELADAVTGVVGMLAGDEPNPVCNKQIAVEQFCALDAHHIGDCRPVVHGPVDGKPGHCVCDWVVDGFTAPELLDEKLQIHIDAMSAKTGPQLASAWQNEDGTIGQECRCGVTFDGFDRKDAALLDRLFAEHECNTLPPVCGYVLGCKLGADFAPAPAEPGGSGLCVQHRAEAYPEHGPASVDNGNSSIVCYCQASFQGGDVAARFADHLTSVGVATDGIELILDGLDDMAAPVAGQAGA